MLMEEEMGKVIIINIHSLIDVITNSSTELFILDTKKSIGFIIEILQHAIDLHNIANETNLKFDDIFIEPYYQDDKTFEGWSDYYSSNLKDGIVVKGIDDNSIPYWMFDFIENTFASERFHLG